MKIAIVSFKNEPKRYHFYTLITDLKEGDNVVVDTQRRSQIATFEGYVESPEHKPHKWVIGKVQQDNIKQIEDIENKKVKLKREIDERVRLYQGIPIYEFVALVDPTMKKLLEDYNKLFPESNELTLQEKAESLQLKKTFT